jgi:hypothetical protein
LFRLPKESREIGTENIELQPQLLAVFFINITVTGFVELSSEFNSLRNPRLNIDFKFAKSDGNIFCKRTAHVSSGSYFA